MQQMIALRRQVASREFINAEGAALVSPENLQVAPSSPMLPVLLPDLWIRPPLGGRGRKLKGSLEAHTNGFRYSTARPEERVDIIYSNIKHAFFQPDEREYITLFHFHLHNHIMVGNRKTKNVQFFVDVVDEVVRTISEGHQWVSSSDEIVEEQWIRERKNKINMEFQTFVDMVNGLWAQRQFMDLDLKFDIPCSELGFHGVPFKASVFIMPTSTCLVELLDVPFLVVTLSEIGNVNLERVGFGQKNFRMEIVFKDSKKDVLKINRIPLSALNAILEWLDTTDLTDYKSFQNMRSILKTIAAEPEKSTEDGGFEFMDVDVSDSQSKGNEESDK